MKFLVVAIGLFAATQSFGSDLASEIFPSMSGQFKVQGVATKMVSEGYVSKPDPLCTSSWPEGNACGEVRVPYGKQSEVIVVTIEYNPTMSVGDEEAQRVREIFLSTKLFSAIELEKIRKASGYKAVQLANQLFELLPATTVKLAVSAPVYGSCDSEQNCLIVDHRPDLSDFKKVSLVRKK